MSKKEGNVYKTRDIQSIIQSTNFLDKNMPQSLKLGQGFFAQIVRVGDFVQHQNVIISHFDEKTFISCIITLGNS